MFISISFSDSECKDINFKLPHDSRGTVKNKVHNEEAVLLLHSFTMFIFLKDSTSPRSLCIRLLSPKDLSRIPAIKWGINYEDKARQQYTEEMSTVRCKILTVENFDESGLGKL